MEEKELTGQIIKDFYTVYNTLGYGYLESVYQNAIMLELIDSGLKVEAEKAIAVHYNGHVVGTFAADLVVEGRVIVELKAKESLNGADEAQLTNYLRATEIEIGLLFNFGRSPEFKRKYFSNTNKQLTTVRSDEVLLKALFADDPF